MKTTSQRIFRSFIPLAGVVSLLALFGGVISAQAANGSWNADADGGWSTAANWAGNTIADGAGSSAIFSNDVTAVRIVTLDSSRTLGNLTFGDADISTAGGWIVTGNTLTLSNSAETPVITVNNSAVSVNGNAGPNDARIESALTGGQGFVKRGSGTLNITNANTFSAPVQLEGGSIIFGNALALGNQEVRYNGGGLRFYNGGPTFTNLNRVLTIGTITNVDLNYDAFNGRWEGSGTMRLYSNARFTIGGGSAATFTNFTGTLDLVDSPANEIRLNLGSGATPYDLSKMTLNAGSNAGRFDFRPTTAPVIVRIGALAGSGANSKLETSEQAAGTSLTWEIGYLNTSTTFAGILRNRNGDATRVGHLTKVGTGTLTLSGNSAYTGNTVITNGVLALAGTATLAGTPSITVYLPGVFDVSGLATNFSLAAGKTLAGNSVVTGSVVAASGLISPGINGVGTLTFANNLNLGGNGGTNLFELTSPGVGDKLMIGGDLTLDGAVVVRVVPTGASIPNGTYTLYKWSGNFTGDTNNLLLDAPAQTGTLSLGQNLATKEIYLQVSGVAGAADLTWRGDGSANAWDLATQNWRKNGNPSVFNNGDNVTFDNSGSNNVPVSLAASMNPATILVNASQDYSFSTSSGGKITGSGILTKSNTGKLTISTDDDTTGLINVLGGVLQVGSAGTSGALGTSPVVVSNSAQLVFNRSDTTTAANVISGNGQVVQAGAGSTLTLSGANTHSGGTVVSNGTLNIANAAGLGSGPLVMAGGTVAAANLTVNNPLSVTADSTITNTSGEIQLTSSSISGTGGALTLSGNLLRFTGTGFNFSRPIVNNLTGSLRSYNNTGSQIFSGVISGTGIFQRRWSDSTVGNDGATIFTGQNTYSGGTLLREGGIGFGASTVSTTPPTVDSGPIGTGTLTQDNATYTAVFAYGAPRVVANPIVLNSAGQAFIINGSLELTLTGTIDLGGGNKAIQVDNTARTYVTGDINNGNLIKTGNGGLYLEGNINAASTVVSNGTLAGGCAFNNGMVTVASGGTLAPGNSIGTMNFYQGLTIQGNLLIEVNNSSNPKNDNINLSNVGLASTVGSTLTVSNLGPALAVGDTFNIFGVATPGGENLTIIGGGAVWTNRLAIDGTIKVVALTGAAPKPVINATVVAGGNLVFSGTNGTAGGTFYVRASTNITAAVSNWARESTNTFGAGGAFSVTNSVNPNAPRKFYLLEVP